MQNIKELGRLRIVPVSSWPLAANLSFSIKESRAHHCHEMDLEPTPLMVQWNLKNHIGTTKELKRSVTISLISGSARSSWSLVMSSRPQRNKWCHKNSKRTSEPVESWCFCSDYWSIVYYSVILWVSAGPAFPQTTWQRRSTKQKCHSSSSSSSSSSSRRRLGVVVSWPSLWSPSSSSFLRPRCCHDHHRNNKSKQPAPPTGRQSDNLTRNRKLDSHQRKLLHKDYKIHERNRAHNRHALHHQNLWVCCQVTPGTQPFSMQPQRVLPFSCTGLQWQCSFRTFQNIPVAIRGAWIFKCENQPLVGFVGFVGCGLMSRITLRDSQLRQIRLKHLDHWRLCSAEVCIEIKSQPGSDRKPIQNGQDQNNPIHALGWTTLFLGNLFILQLLAANLTIARIDTWQG